MPISLSPLIIAGTARPPFPPFLAGYLESGGLAAEWEAALGLETRAAVARSPLPVDLLSREELACYRNLGDSSRRAWLAGRAALRRLAARLDPGSGPPPLHPAGYAVAHCGGIAVAAACLGAPGAGLGVDVAIDGPMDPVSAAAYLAREESDELAARFPGSRPAKAPGHWPRIRSVKAALYRSDPDRQGRHFGDYRALSPASRRGKARLRPGLGPREFRYVTHAFAGWRISLAAALPLHEG